MFTKILFNGYKSFPVDTPVCLRDLRRVNVIIGKNNTGKSSILDIVSACTDIKYATEILPYVGKVSMGFPLTETYINNAFKGYSSNNNRGNIYSDVMKTIGQEYDVDLDFERLSSYAEAHKKKWSHKMAVQSESIFITSQLKQDWVKVAKDIANDAKNWMFRRVAADRDIVPEVEKKSDDLNSNGAGASNLIREFINNSEYEESLIHVKLLEALNKVMMPDSEFAEIKIQQIEQNEKIVWEVFLREKGCQRFALSKSGSGLKTIILLLLNLLVVPNTPKYKDKKIFYGFEELENNLHPALQRRVFEYIYKYATENDIMVFLTTHSHVAINEFFDKENAQIYHVIKDNNESSVHKIETHLDKIGILDDLNVKASDLLQSNGIIWVEGPSDRVYIKRWLEVLCNCPYKEGTHYQFMYYGGKLLSHYSTEDTEDLINILTTNRNSAIVIDSDKKNRQASVNKTKKRINAEFKKSNMFVWITKGKEIENYLSLSSVNQALGVMLKKQCEQYQVFSDYIGKTFPNFSGQKVSFANKIKDFINTDNANILDLETQIKSLHTQVEDWNR